MATESPFLRDGSNVTASANLSTNQFYAVALSGARTVGLPGTINASQFVYGILQNKPSSGLAADVAIFGITKAYAGGTISAASLLESASGGAVIAYTSGASATVIGYSLESASISQIFTMFLVGPNVLTS